MKRKETGFFARLRAYTPDRFQQTIFWITLALFVSNVLSAVFADEQQDASRFIFSAFSCFGMLVVIALPVLATRFFKVKIPRMIQLVYVVFAFCGIVLGTSSTSSTASNTGTRFCISFPACCWRRSASS